MQYPTIAWGIITPWYERDGFIFTMILVFLFSLGWISLFTAAYRPKVTYFMLIVAHVKVSRQSLRAVLA